MTCKEILKYYWGYDEFRPLQEEVINEILAGKDTLTLMPTGGGKSITYQVPALLMDGICLVITPLIALMKDQVEDLKRSGLPAVAIFTGMKTEDITSHINRAIAGKVKFLYVSPERLSSESFRMKLKQMKICLMAVDEAHCISQWGYDFRPSYLQIAEVRPLFPNVPILALTATATPKVAEDIQDKLHFSTPNVLSKSFRRENLAYVVRTTADKQGELLHILSKLNECAIVYVRKRDTAKQLADFLNKNNIKADYYHAGLSSIQRENKQNDWKNDITPVIVATNAFGMGINKADVRIVVHYDAPESVEAYFQEAGRAGRDEKKAFAVLLSNNASVATLKTRITKSFPDKSYIKHVYQCLGNFFQVAEGAGQGYSFEFDADTFIRNFKLEQMKTFSAIRILEICAYLECSDEINAHSQLSFIVDRTYFDTFIPINILMDKVLEFIMRNCPGVFTQSVYVSEQYMADKLDSNRNEVYQILLDLAKRKIIRYIPGNDRLYIMYKQPRLPLSHISISKESYADRKKAFENGINSIIRYVEDPGKCRQLYLVNYFGQHESKSCQLCDICLEAKKKHGHKYEQSLRTSILTLLAAREMHIKEIIYNFGDDEHQAVVDCLREMLDEGEIRYVRASVLSSAHRFYP
ncbi:ATP-dependent DNA helicase RecQ [Bacteroidia bacterium]|nr:ATP-dependent DNA helicase RecQ [Bacteroidia bacterium]